jgi:hypothetical protein
MGAPSAIKPGQMTAKTRDAHLIQALLQQFSIFLSC